MKIDQYISHLRKSKNIIIGVDNGELKLNANKNDLTEEIIRDIKSRKHEIISFFGSFNGLSTGVVIPKAKENDHYVLSPAQQRMYLTQELDKKSTTYNIQIVDKFEGNLTKVEAKNIFKELVKRHEAFRTFFRVIKGEIFQSIVPYDQFDFEVSCFASDLAGASMIINNFIQPFELDKAPLLRVGLIEITPQESILIIDTHHIISDGVSSTILIKDFLDILHLRALPELAVQYRDYAEWIKSEQQQKLVSSQKSFWLEEYSEMPEPLNLPIDYSRPLERDYTSDVVKHELGVEETNKIRSLAEKSGATMFMTLLSVYHVLLSKLSGQDDIVIGVPTAGRQHADLEKVIGMFVNTVCLRNRSDGKESFKEFLHSVKNKALKCFDNQGYQYEELINVLKIERDPGRNPLFDVMFTYQNQEHQEIKLPFSFENRHKVALFDIHLTSWELLSGGLRLEFAYQTSLYSRDTMERFVLYFMEIVRLVSTNAEVLLSEINILPESEKQKLVYTFNDTRVNYPAGGQTLVSLFESQVNRTPENVAVCYEGEKMSYQELQDLSDRIAVYLMDVKGVQRGELVGVMLNRELHLIAWLFGILKTGSAYVPISPDYPMERKGVILEGAQLRALVTRVAYVESDLALGSTTLIDIDEVEQVLGDQSTESFKADVSSQDLAYVIHTSGSTGVPKGVMIEHGSVVNRLLWMQEAYPLSEEDVLIQKTPLVFDVSVWELFWWSFTGASLVLVAPEGEKDPKKLIGTIRANKVSVIHFVPSMLDVFLSVLNSESYSSLASLSRVFTSGEALKADHVNQFRAGVYRHSGCRLTNLYGPTEAAVDVSYYDCSLSGDVTKVPIGKPISNIRFYILDRYNQLSPLGSYGELCIGGVGLARGYLHKRALTLEKFVEHPELGRIYHTGDLARWLPDGNVEYSGRIDTQVKIRGFRIELGDIEHQLQSHAEIATAVVDVKYKGGDPYLVGYYVSESGSELEMEMLRSFLLKKLPDYMVPQNYVMLDSIPLTVTGKVNRRALPEAELTSGVVYQAPKTEEERLMASIWSEILLLDQVGLLDNFFNSGGDSIKAIRLIYEMNVQLQSHLDLSDLYTHQTIGELSVLLHEKQGQGQELYDRAQEEVRLFSDWYEKTIGIDPSYEAVYPMSGVEKGMVFYTLLKKEGEDDFHKILYHEQNVYPIRWANFRFDVFVRAAELMMDKHEELRKVFDVDNFAHIIKRKMSPALYYWDVSDQPEEVQSRYILARIDEERLKATDFSGLVPLWRMNIVKVKESLHYLIFDMHHSVMDGWSLHAFLAELNDTCVYLDRDPNYKLEKLRSGYRDHIIGELKDTYNESSIEYWQKELLEYNRFEFLPTGAEHKYVTKFYELGPGLKQDLEKLATRLGSSLKNLCFAAYLYTLKTLSGSNDFVTGFTVNNRPIVPDGEKILGCFLNAVPFRARIPEQSSWRKFIAEVDDRLIKLKEHERIPLQGIVSMVGEATAKGNPFFDVTFNFIDFWVIHDMQTHDSATDTKDIYFDHDDRDVNQNTLLDIHIKATYDLLIHMEYSTTFVDAALAEKICVYFENVLKQFVKNINSTSDTGFIIPPEEKRLLLNDFNATETSYPRDKTIVHLFEEQVKRCPGKMALFYNDQPFMAYEELDKKSNQIANYLKLEKGVQKCDLVGIMLEREEYLLPCIFGILKAGAAYVPIDPNFPEKRIHNIIEDAGLKVLITKSKFIYPSLKTDNRLIDLDTDLTKIDVHSCTSIQHDFGSSDLAYVIYTSGSTGKPKGVMIEHGALVNRLLWMQKIYPLTSEDVLLQKTPIVFDVSVWELFWWSLAGASLCLLKPGDEKDPQELINAILKNKVSVIHFVPSMFGVFLSEINEQNYNDLKSLRQVFTSGEALKPEHANQFRKGLYQHCGTALTNLYGPTEATVDVSYFDCDLSAPVSLVPIGKPIDNIKLYVLDSNRQLVPLGVPGELHIAGDGVARGYLNNETLTNEKFVDIPQIGQGSFYKTGDLVRWLDDGNIEFLGRIDHQVKIRGLRIELGEIENQLLCHEHIKEVILIDRELSGEKHLICYYTSVQEIDPEELRKYLLKVLPEYMVPFFYVHLEKMPLTSSGKVDRKILPDVTMNDDDGYFPPSNEFEARLVGIWEDVLKEEMVGVHDNFFRLGGTSLNAIQVVSKIRKDFDMHVDLPLIFEHPTIEELAAALEELEQKAYQQIEPIAKWEYYDVSFSQKHYLYLDKLNDPSIIVPSAYVLDGLDRISLEKAFALLVERHESLRTTFVEIDGVAKQKIHEVDAFGFQVAYVDVREIADEEQIRMHVQKELYQPFNLWQGPLIRSKLFQIADQKYILTLALHHIIIDGWSMDILREELNYLYGVFFRNEESKLKPLRIQYKDFTAWHNRIISGKDGEKHRQYWMDQLSGDKPLWGLTNEQQISSTKGYRRSYVINIDDEYSQLKEFGQQQEVTVFMILLAAIKVLLHSYSGQDEIIVGSQSAGRDHPELQNQIGYYSNGLILKTLFSNDDNFASLLEKVKETCLNAYKHQEFPDSEIEEAFKHEDRPLFSVMVVNNETVPNNEIAELHASETIGTKAGDLSISYYNFESETKANDAPYYMILVFNIERIGDRLSIVVHYNTTVFDEAQMEKLSADLLMLLKNLIIDPDKLLTQGDHLGLKKISN